MTPYVEPIIKIFLDNCRNQEVKMATKPHILSCFGDIAFQIGGSFDRYLPAVMTILGQAAETTARYDRDDEDMIEHINVLRESILDAYIGIVQGLSTDGKQELLLQPAFVTPVQQVVYLNPVISLLQLIANDDHSNEAVIQRSIGLIGDLGSNLKGKVAQLRGAKWVMDLLNSAATLSDTTIKTAQYTKAVRLSAPCVCPWRVMMGMACMHALAGIIMMRWRVLDLITMWIVCCGFLRCLTDCKENDKGFR